ncbi:unnamed protein product [Prorocentrum cordatum]|uniref:Uncharacterized protein n=1 Tax=Prorocentrum cordatum TaxID=2364126 RepID=A0ABN9YGQ1_9DINO|nr:unnamed protein product [Polarella glacialis]
MPTHSRSASATDCERLLSLEAVSRVTTSAVEDLVRLCTGGFDSEHDWRGAISDMLEDASEAMDLLREGGMGCQHGAELLRILALWNDLPAGLAPAQHKQRRLETVSSAAIRFEYSSHAPSKYRV